MAFAPEGARNAESVGYHDLWYHMLLFSRLCCWPLWQMASICTSQCPSAVSTRSWGITLSSLWDHPSSGYHIVYECWGLKAQHDYVFKWKHFLRYWPFLRGIHRSPVNSLHKGQWRRDLMFSLICAQINGWVNNREAGDLRHHRTHYDIIVMHWESWTNNHRFCISHWGRVTHICLSKLTIIGSDNGLAPGRRQAIIRTSARILLIGSLGTNFSEILIGIQTFSFTKMHFKTSSGK